MLTMISSILAITCAVAITFLVFFLLLFLLISFISGRTSSWPALSERYAAPWPGGGFTFGKASVGRTTYKNLLQGAVGPSGLHLRVNLPFNGEPIRVPWDELRRVDRIKPLFGIGQGRVVYEIGNPKLVRFVLWDSEADRIEDARLG